MSKRQLGVAAAVLAAGVAVYLLLGRGGDSEQPGDSPQPAAKSAAGRAAPSAPALPDPARISGRVTSADGGAPIAGAVVFLNAVEQAPDALPALPSSLVARTGDDGAWSVAGVPPGGYRVSATADGFLPGLTDAVSLAAGAAVDGVDLSLEPGGNRLTGVVSDVTGGPIHGAVVQLTPVHGMLSIRDDHGYAALTGDDGRYTMQVGDGRYRATASHDEYSGDVDFVELRGGEKTLDFSLTPGGTIEGVVLSGATGEPVPGAHVRYSREATVAMASGRSMAVGAGAGAVVADDRGAFRIRGLDSGTISLTASAVGAASTEPTTVPLAIAEQITGVEVFVADAFAISGTVIVDDDPQRPARGVTVFALAPASAAVRASAPTGADGAFRIDGLPPGRYRLQTSSNEYVDSGPLARGGAVSVDDADVDGVTVSVASGAMITGHVEPRGIAEVGISPKRDPSGLPGIGPGFESIAIMTSSVRTREDGEFSIGPIPPGELTLVARAGDGRKGELALELGAKGARDVVIALESKASLAGVVVDADGKPVSDAMVALSKKRNKERVMMVVNGRDVLSEQSPTHEDGSFLIRGLDAGDYELTVRDRGGETLAWAKPADKDRPREPIAISIAENSDRTGLTLRVEARNGVIRGVVVGPDGSPTADAWVTATPHRDEPGLGDMLGGMAPPPGEHGEGDEPGDERVEVRAMVMVTDDEGGGGDAALAGIGFGGSVPPALTDDRGRFEITGLRKGSYDLMAEGMRGTARGFEQGVDTGADTTVKLVALTRIDGTVTLDGAPVSAFTVSLRGASLRDKTVRNPDGKFSIHRVDPGDYELEVSAAQGKGTAKVTVVAGKAAQVKVELATLSAVTGTLVDEQGAPIAGAMVLLGSGSGGMVSITMEDGEEPSRTADDGTFRVQAAPGNHLLVVIGADSPRPLVHKRIEVAPGRDLDVGTIRPDSRKGGPPS